MGFLRSTWNDQDCLQVLSTWRPGRQLAVTGMPNPPNWFGEDSSPVESTRTTLPDGGSVLAQKVRQALDGNPLEIWSSR